MTDAAGVVVWAADYKPFGEATITVSTITNNLRFPGQYFDAETGLNYNYIRDYAPMIGRYIEADPLGIRRGENHLYVYVENKPVILTDPTGLAWNGNFWPGFKPQDGICSSPASGLNSNPCFKKCCQAHDKCFTENQCNASSWIGMGIVNKACQKCDEAAAECVLKNLPNEKNNHGQCGICL